MLSRVFRFAAQPSPGSLLLLALAAARHTGPANAWYDATQPEDVALPTKFKTDKSNAPLKRVLGSFNDPGCYENSPSLCQREAPLGKEYKP